MEDGTIKRGGIMSDEQAQKKESELAQVKDEETKEKTAEEKAAEEQAKRMWSVTLLIDPETWDFEMLMNANVKKQSQIDILLNAAQKQITLASQARVIGQFVVRLQNAKPKKGLFGKR